jgi:hypothetical protein
MNFSVTYFLTKICKLSLIRKNSQYVLVRRFLTNMYSVGIPTLMVIISIVLVHAHVT